MMIELPIYNTEGKQVETLSIDPADLGTEVRPALLKQAYVIAHTNQRQGSARTKNRSRVEGSTRKLYKQKHTGNARVGPGRTNLRKGGGVPFAKVRTRDDFRPSLTKQMRRLANRNALLAKLVDNEVKCFAEFAFQAPKTQQFAALLSAVGVDRTCLVAVDPGNRNAYLSARNLVGVDVVRVAQMNAFELLNHRYLVLDKATLTSFLDGSCWAKDEDDATAAKSAKKAPQKSGKAA
jgi:large subunit ribosomal protein L4